MRVTEAPPRPARTDCSAAARAAPRLAPPRRRAPPGLSTASARSSAAMLCSTSWVKKKQRRVRAPFAEHRLIRRVLRRGGQEVDGGAEVVGAAALAGLPHHGFAGLDGDDAAVRADGRTGRQAEPRAAPMSSTVSPGRRASAAIASRRSGATGISS
ncbi:hypothetical protein Ddc_22042 [Ditylenchus destructor]|nr:hypothetical protein Ddc_22042 [Ditylenchus destructor]